MGSGAAATAGLAGLALVGCGDDDDDDNGGTQPTAAPSSSTGSSPTAEAVVRGGTLRLPLSGASSANPPTIFPFENLTYLAQTPAAFQYSRLLRGKNGPNVDNGDNTAMEGDIVSKWEQPDNQTYVFTMKPNVKWQNKAPMNGRAITATDFVKPYDAYLGISQNAAGWKAPGARDLDRSVGRRRPPPR